MHFFRRSTRIIVTAGLVAVPALLAAQQRTPQGMSHVNADVLAQACSPSLAFERPAPSLLITGGQDSFSHATYAAGDLLTINAGTDNGIEVGQEYYLRRVQPPRGSAISRATPATIATTGWVKVYAVDKRMSLVTVSHVCEQISVGDYLEPFELPTVPTPDPNPPKQQKENYGHVMIGTDRRTMFGKNDFFVVDRGSDHGVLVGSRFIVYRDKRKNETNPLSTDVLLPSDISTPEFLFEIGEAVAVNVTPETSTLKAIKTLDAFWSGDYVALRK
jgi:hypothetical protein